MDLIEWAIDPWGQSVPIHIAWKREFFLKHYDPYRWKIQKEPSGDIGPNPHSP
jgi:hypothetical protein